MTSANDLITEVGTNFTDFFVVPRTLVYGNHLLMARPTQCKGKIMTKTCKILNTEIGCHPPPQKWKFQLRLDFEILKLTFES